jgi:O-antigen/teichoic acid export membrane protein
MTRAEKFLALTCTRDLRRHLGARSARATLVTGAASFADFAVRIGSTAILARLVLPEHFGLIMMTTAIIAVADQLRELGLSSATVQQADITHGQVTNLFWINVAAGLGLAGLIAGLSPWIAGYYHDPRLVPVTIALATTVVFGGLTVQHQALLTRQLRLGRAASIRLTTSVVSTVLAIALAWFDYGYWALVWREVARVALLAAGMWWSFPWLPGLPDRKTDVRPMLKFGANLTGGNIFGTLTAGMDRFFLGRVWGAGAVGLYRQAFQLVSAPTDQLLSPLYHVAHPALSMLQGDPERYRRVYLKLLTLVCALTMPISLFVAVYADAVTAVLLGPAWAAAAPILCVLSIGTFLKQAVGSTAYVLITRGRAGTYFRLTLLHNVTLIAAIWIGVRWGAAGVAIAEVTTTYLLLAPRLHYGLRQSPITLRSFFATLARPVAASLVMVFALLEVRASFPAPSAGLDLALGGMVAALLFGGTWILLPGGVTEFQGLFTHLRTALRGQAAPSLPTETAVAAS